MLSSTHTHSIRPYALVKNNLEAERQYTRDLPTTKKNNPPRNYC